MPQDYYLDESGNTGDLALAGPDFTFSDQPLFTLACVGVGDPSALAAEMQRLRQVHKIQAAELKFSSVRNRPGFVAELIAFLAARDWPIMIEVVDKRYAIAIQIVECLVLPAYGPHDFSASALFVKNTFADIICHHAPNAVLNAFASACIAPTRDAHLNASFALQHWINGLPRNEITAGLRDAVQDTFADIRDADDAKAAKFLPDPDRARSGKLVHMLPHVSSLANIYGRINHAHTRGVGDIRLYHDEQMQFDRALEDVMALAEGPREFELNHNPMVDFTFTARASLQFVNSKGNAGIETADILAGFASFLTRPFLKPDGKLPPEWIAPTAALLATLDASRGRGLNLVITGPGHETMMRKLQRANAFADS